METKTYFASSIHAAMEVARRELGPDAMLVNSGPAPEAARAYGRLEVTFAWDATASSKAEAKPENVAQGQARSWPVDTGLRPIDGRSRRGESGLDDIRLEISALRAAIGRPPIAMDASPQASNAAVPEIDDYAVQLLCETGMESDTARQIASAARVSGQVGDGIVRELKARIPVAGFLPLQSEESRTLAFVGPAGRGKTTSLIKIAVRYGLSARIPIRIYLAGAHGVGAVEQMARYAAILGVPFQSLESFESLNLVLDGDKRKGLVLIDTPGTACADRQDLESMTKFFARRTDIETHLVLRAEARSADMQYMVSRYAAFQPSRLLFTGVDEVRGLGAAADTMIRSGIACSFFGTGPQAPDNLEEVDVAKLVRTLWTANGLAARAA